MRLGSGGNLAVWRALTAVLVAFGAGLVAGCASTSDGGPAPSLRDRMFGARGDNTTATAAAESQPDVDPSYFLRAGYCPQVEIQPGAGSLAFYERNHDGEAAFVRYQGSIGTMARECTVTGADRMTIKLGVAGRVVAGPKGGAGSVTLPLRVAVVKQHGAKVLYTKTYNIPATVTAPAFGTDFSQVIDQIAFTLTPDDRDLIVYVGFDQGNRARVPSG